MLFFRWNVTQSVQSGWKRSVVIHLDPVTHPLFHCDPVTHPLFIDNWGHIITIELFVFLGLNVEMLFMLFSCVMGRKSVNTKHAG